MGVVDRARQHIGMAVDLVEGQPVLPGVERLRRDERRQAGDRARMIGRDLRRAVELRRREEGRPVDARRLLRKVVPGPDRRGFGEITALFTPRLRLGSLLLWVLSP